MNVRSYGEIEASLKRDDVLGQLAWIKDKFKRASVILDNKQNLCCSPCSGMKECLDAVRTVVPEAYEMHVNKFGFKFRCKEGKFKVHICTKDERCWVKITPCK